MKNASTSTNHLILASNNPDGLAVDDFTRSRTWAELADRSIRVARFLPIGYLGLPEAQPRTGEPRRPE